MRVGERRPGRRALERHATAHPAADAQHVAALDLVHVEAVVAVLDDQAGRLLRGVAELHQRAAREDAQRVHRGHARGQAHELQAERERPVRLCVQHVAVLQQRDDAVHDGLGHAAGRGDLARRQPPRRGGEGVQHGEAVGEERRGGAELVRRRAQAPGLLVLVVHHEAPGPEHAQQGVQTRPGDVALRGDDGRRGGRGPAGQELEDVERAGRRRLGDVLVRRTRRCHVLDLAGRLTLSGVQNTRLQPAGVPGVGTRVQYAGHMGRAVLRGPPDAGFMRAY